MLILFRISYFKRHFSIDSDAFLSHSITKFHQQRVFLRVQPASGLPKQPKKHLLLVQDRFEKLNFDVGIGLGFHGGSDIVIRIFVFRENVSSIYRRHRISPPIDQMLIIARRIILSLPRSVNSFTFLLNRETSDDVTIAVCYRFVAARGPGHSTNNRLHRVEFNSRFCTRFLLPRSIFY